MKLTWQPPVSDGGSAITHYLITYGRSSDSLDISQLEVPASPTSYLITNLSAGRRYRLSIQAKNRIGYSTSSDYFTYTAVQVPDAPDYLANVLTITNVEQVGLSWVVPAFQGGALVEDYRLWYSDTD